MALIKWDPFNEIDDMVSRLERYTGKMGWPSLRRENFTTSEWTPKVDIVESDGEYTIKAELPEINKEDVKVSVENGELTISGERKQEKEEKGKNSTASNATMEASCAVLPCRTMQTRRTSRRHSRTAC
jgi:HSP20 family protein